MKDLEWYYWVLWPFLWMIVIIALIWSALTVGLRDVVSILWSEYVQSEEKLVTENAPTAEDPVLVE